MLHAFICIFYHLLNISTGLMFLLYKLITTVNIITFVKVGNMYQQTPSKYSISLFLMTLVLTNFQCLASYGRVYNSWLLSKLLHIKNWREADKQQNGYSSKKIKNLTILGISFDNQIFHTKTMNLILFSQFSSFHFFVRTATRTCK